VPPPLLDLVAPPRCLACGAPGARELCAACRAALPWLRDPCPRCALPRPCGPPCPARRSRLDGARAAVALEGPARALVHALKFRAALPAAAVMAATLVRPLRDLDGVLVPVPGTSGRVRGRGFDQAECLAAELARRAGRPVIRALARTRGARRQTGAARAQRRATDLGVAVRDRVKPLPSAVVLVDDVHTTGATLAACARVLRAHDVATVSALTFARTLPDNRPRA
jgi:ComF family protein